MKVLTYQTLETLEAGLDHIRQSPKDRGRLELIVRRPVPEQREVIEAGQLDLIQGLVGDNWRSRGSKHTPDGTADLNRQLTIMNSRLIALLAGEKENWQLAGDQLFIDLDISIQNLSPGVRLAIGEAIVEISDQLHSGCAKFSGRFGSDALRFVNSRGGRELRLRGVNTKIVQPGLIHVGDLAVRI